MMVKFLHISTTSAVLTLDHSLLAQGQLSHKAYQHRLQSKTLPANN